MKPLTKLCICLALTGYGLLFPGCKKEKTEPEPEPIQATNTERLTGRNFKMTAATIDPPVLGVTDYYAQMPDCEKDNLIRFDTPDIFKEDEGPTKCNTNDPQTKTGTWTWNPDETILTISIEGATQSWDVLTNNGTTLKVKYTEQINGINYSLTTTLVKQ